MSLKLTIPSELCSKTFETYNLRSTDPNADPNERGPSDSSDTPTFTFDFDNKRRFHANERVNVYHGHLTRFPDKPALDVVCKIGFGKLAADRVENDARFYLGKLSHLQGVCIPPCHGYFMGHTLDDGKTACIVYLITAESLSDRIFCTSFKTALIDAVIAIHDAGVRHGSLGERNVLDYKGQPMLIDLENAEEEDILYELCIDLRVWTPDAHRLHSIPP